MKGKLYLCATPIGNLGDISARLIETLKEVDLIAAEDTRRTQKLLNHIGISKPQTSYFEHNKREKDEYLVKFLLSGKNVALVSDAGTPAISDPGESLVSACIDADIDIVPIPGPVAAISALTVSGLATSRFSFEGFLSINKKARLNHLEKVKNDDRTLIFYEAPHKLLRTLKDILNVLGDRRIALCRELTKLHEQVVRCSVSQAIDKYSENLPRGEFVLIIEGNTNSENKWENIDIETHISLYISKGIDERDAIKTVARDRGVPKREIYNKIKTMNKHREFE